MLSVKVLHLFLFGRMHGWLKKMNIFITVAMLLQEAKTEIGIRRSCWAVESSTAETICPLYSKDNHREEEINGEKKKRSELSRIYWLSWS